jgi:ubiquinone/menaquinone biosynthesis C-methylase UbiE
MMDLVRPHYNEQSALWNGAAGRAWVDHQDLLDHMFKPLEDLLLEAVFAGPGGRVLDIGCGTGSTTLAIQHLLGTKGQCTGIDVSEPMLAAAQRRAQARGSSASFIQADAQTHTFAPASFDMIVSRIGVMFFDDFAAAFENLRRAAREGAELHFVSWRGPEDNPFMTAAERAAAPLLPNIPVRRPDAPGQFAFADQRRVRRILEESGWSGITIRPVDLACTLPAKDLARYLGRLGPVGLALQDADDQTRTQVVETVAAAFAPYTHDDEVRFTAACWMVSAAARSASRPIGAARA